MTDNFFNNVGKFINEACCGYYSNSVAGSTGGASAAVLHALKGMHAVDTPLGDDSSAGLASTVRGQVAKQAEYTFLQRNYLLSQIDRIAGHWISYAIKAIIASVINVQKPLIFDKQTRCFSI